jgi:glycine dehydrogenase subunit 1
MPFIPHTEQDIAQMLSCVESNDVAQLFSEIPESIATPDLSQFPAGMNEWELTRFAQSQAAKNKSALNFIGAGSYEHHIPAAVWDIAGRGEFMTAYTPYQAEASQGSLQVIYEFQSMMAALTKMDVSNASLYDGASGLAEAILMAVRSNRSVKSKKILMPRTVHPHYREVVETIVKRLDITIELLEFDSGKGCVDVGLLPAQTNAVALVIPYPNFFGALEEVDQLTDWAHAHNALVIAVANPMALGLLKAPGDWGKAGADIVCGEAQPFGMPLASGGPYAGYLCCKQQFVRQMPGRIVGKTHDLDGKVGYTLTLQAREQHIRRAKATSNICTNQGLLVTAATIYMSLMGPEGIYRTALLSHQRAQQLMDQLVQLQGVEKYFADGHYFHESVIELNCDAKVILDELAKHGVIGGIALGDYFPKMKKCILVCATETKTTEDLAAYKEALIQAMQIAGGVTL